MDDNDREILGEADFVLVSSSDYPNGTLIVQTVRFLFCVSCIPIRNCLHRLCYNYQNNYHNDLFSLSLNFKKNLLVMQDCFCFERSNQQTLFSIINLCFA